MQQVQLHPESTSFLSDLGVKMQIHLQVTPKIRADRSCIFIQYYMLFNTPIYSI